jgi:hypothetical protein
MAEMAEKEVTAKEAQQTQEETITINGVDYKLSSLNEESLVALEQLRVLDQLIELKEDELRYNKYARQYLIDFVAKNVDSFEAVEAVEEDDNEDLPPAA